MNILNSFFVLLLSIGYASSSFALDIDPSTPLDLEKQVVQDIETLRGLKFSGQSPLNAAIFGQADGRTYKKWFEARILSFGFDPNSRSGAVAYNDRRQRMMVTELYLQDSLTLVDRLMVLIHEARHSEVNNNYWIHQNCPNPFLNENGEPVKSSLTGVPLAGESACDVAAKGAYGTGAVFLDNIARFCTNCSDSMRKQAAAQSRELAIRVVNKSERLRLENDRKLSAPK